VKNPRWHVITELSSRIAYEFRVAAVSPAPVLCHPMSVSHQYEHSFEQPHISMSSARALPTSSASPRSVPRHPAVNCCALLVHFLSIGASTLSVAADARLRCAIHPR
jgi:hypothetical protein